MLLAWMTWSLTLTCRNVGDAAVALNDCAKKTFQLALLLFVGSVVPYQAIPTDPSVGPVSSHGNTLVLVSVPSLTLTGWLHVAPLSVDETRNISWSFE